LRSNRENLDCQKGLSNFIKEKAAYYEAAAFKFFIIELSDVGLRLE